MSRGDRLYAALVGYLMTSIVLWLLRMNFDDGGCRHLYMDYVFPLTKMHCEIE